MSIANTTTTTSTTTTTTSPRTTTTTATTATTTATTTIPESTTQNTTPLSGAPAKSRVNIPLLKSLTREETPAQPVSAPAPGTVAVIESGSPGAKPLMLPGMPGVPLSERASARIAGANPPVPLSPRRPPQRLLPLPRSGLLQSSTISPPASPRQQEMRVISDADALKIINESVIDIEKSIDLQYEILTTLEQGQSLPQLNTSSQEASTPSSSPSKDTKDPETLQASPPTLQIRRVSFRMKQPDTLETSTHALQEPPVTPRNAAWNKAAPSTADRGIIPSNTSSTSRPKVIAETVKLYSSALTANLRAGKKDITTTIDREDPKIPYDELSGILKPFYAKNSKGYVPLSPLLRTLFKSSLEAKPHWSEALQELEKSYSFYDYSIRMDESSREILDKEKRKLEPLAEKIVSSLFPRSADSKVAGRRLSDCVLSEEFIRDVLVVVDHETLQACKGYPSLSLKDINNLRCAVLIDVVVTRTLEPLLLQKFPLMPNKSQVLMQSQLVTQLKKAVNEMAPDFLRKSEEGMPQNLTKFFHEKSLNEQKAAAEEKARIKKEQYLSAMDKFNQLYSHSTKTERDLTHFNKLREGRDRPFYFRHNRELFEKVIAQYGLDNVDESLGRFISKEMRTWLDTHTCMQDATEIRAELLSSLKSYALESANSSQTNAQADPVVSAAIDALSLAVANDLINGATHRRGAYDYKLLDWLAAEPVSPRRTVDDAAILNEDMMMTVTMGLDMPVYDDEDDSSSFDAQASASPEPDTANTGPTTTTTTTATTTTTTATGVTGTTRTTSTTGTLAGDAQAPQQGS